MNNPERYYGSEIAALEKKSFAGNGLSEAEIVSARIALQSSYPMERIIGSEALLRGEVARELKADALDTMKRLCRDENSEPARYESRLVWALSIIPRSFLSETEELKSFAYRMASSNNNACRMNAVQTLFQLARSGDKKAKELIQQAANDPNDDVKHNAVNALRRLKEGPE